MDISGQPVHMEDQLQPSPGYWACLPERTPASLWIAKEQLIHRVIHIERRPVDESISWKIGREMSIYGGAIFKLSGCSTLLLHTQGHLSTDIRELSTKDCLNIDFLGIQIP